MPDQESEGEAFGHLLGLIEFRGHSREKAVDIAAEMFDYDRATYEKLVEQHWS